MKIPAISTRVGLFLTASAFAAIAGAQSYGPGSQVLTIGAAEFVPVGFDEAHLRPDGYLYAQNPPAGSAAPESPTVDDYRAPVALPEGAGIEKLCLWAYDDQEDGSDVGAGLLAVKLVYGGETPHQDAVGLYVQSDSDIGYRRYCREFSETLRARRDVDGDGVLDPVTYYVRASMVGAGTHLGLGGVQITWRRQVSEAPATPSFADVPESHAFYPFIEALAAAGITGGCGGGNFCPDAPLKRGQMAAFLARALGLHWVD